MNDDRQQTYRVTLTPEQVNTVLVLAVRRAHKLSQHYRRFLREPIDSRLRRRFGENWRPWNDKTESYNFNLKRVEWISLLEVAADAAMEADHLERTWKPDGSFFGKIQPADTQIHRDIRSLAAAVCQVEVDVEASIAGEEEPDEDPSP